MRHNKVKKRLISVISVLAVIAIVLFLVLIYKSSQTDEGQHLIQFGSRKETIHLWYTDDALTDYLNSKALEFYDNTDIRVDVKQVSGLEYLETINTASLDDNLDTPDLYILSNDSLEKAYLSGLAAELPQTAPIYNEELFSEAARNAVSYHGKYVACPMYFETSALLYNKTYLQQIADEANAAIGEDTSESEEEAPNEEQLVTAQQLIPSSIADILNFADQYSTPENVEYFFRWDVSDIFYNYFFAGNYMIVGGAAGDNTENMNIYNKDAIDCLKVYQALNQFFSIDAKEISYEKVLNDFMEGKIVYTVATTDAVAKLEEAKGNGDFAYEYSIAPVPDINEELLTRSLSVTNCVAVNGYSDKQELARDFARFLTCEYTDTLYSK